MTSSAGGRVEKLAATSDFAVSCTPSKHFEIFAHFMFFSLYTPEYRSKLLDSSTPESISS